MPFYLRTSLFLKAKIDSVAHHMQREDLEICVMYLKFVNQTESILEKHKNHESAEYLQNLVQDAKKSLNSIERR
jgi:hypothetical protein